MQDGGADKGQIRLREQGDKCEDEEEKKAGEEDGRLDYKEADEEEGKETYREKGRQFSGKNQNI
jgi:hypothetical protein